MTTQRQIEAAARAIAVVWESHGDGYLSAGLFEEMAKAAIETAKAAAWEPIETAPKDGTVVDLAWIGMPDVRSGFWDADRRSNSPRPFWNWWSEFGNAMMRANPPTHWRQRPAPPKVI